MTANMSEVTLTENMAAIHVAGKMPKMVVTDQNSSYGSEREYRIALIGRTGSGKSATGNNILGTTAFTSKVSGSSVTKKCQFHTEERVGKKLVVVDTPGLFDTELSNDVVATEIVKCVGMLTPGPHAFILVVQVGRFTKEEQDTVTHFSNIFGEEFYRYLIVLFTRRDDLENHGGTIQNYINDVPEELDVILKRCRYKYTAFDNSPRGQKSTYDVLELMRMVQEITNETGKPYFSNELFVKSELEFQQIAKEILLKEEGDIALKQKKIQKELEAKERKIEAQKRKIEANKLEVKKQENLTMEKNNQEQSLKPDETLQKSETMEKEMEAKRKELEEIVNENEKFKLEKKQELEEIERKHREDIKNMRDKVRKEYERENKNFLSKFVDSATSAALSIREKVVGWFS